MDLQFYGCVERVLVTVILVIRNDNSLVLAHSLDFSDLFEINLFKNIVGY